MIIYNFDDFGYYTGILKEIHDLAAIPKNWTKVSPPDIPEGKFAKYADRRWRLLSEKIYPKKVPLTITKRQAKQQLLLAGLLDDVELGITNITNETEKRLAQIYWEDSQEFERNHPMLISLGNSILGLTEQQLDDLFIEASKL